jgi:hypothetical protein
MIARRDAVTVAEAVNRRQSTDLAAAQQRGQAAALAVVWQRLRLSWSLALVDGYAVVT